MGAKRLCVAPDCTEPSRAMPHHPSHEPVYRHAAKVVDLVTLPGGHRRLRLRAPNVAAAARPGQFVNIRPPLDSAILRRPLGIYRTVDDTDLDILFKVVGRGTVSMAGCRPGDVLDLIGPLGNGFSLDAPPEIAILVAGGFGIAPLYPLARALRGRVGRCALFVGTEEELPLETADSAMHLSFVDPDVSATLTDFEELGVACRVASMREREGFFRGLVTDLLERFVHGGGADALGAGRGRIYACGPWAMLRKTAAIAAEHDLPCDVLLEERMGCGIGACMSCAVRVIGPDGKPAYERACVEGPVFDARRIDWTAK
jgi:dihydroorotate dehydrogenase electron transfer subunit